MIYMKKKILFALGCLLFLGSCIKKDTIIQGSQKTVYEITVSPNQWSQAGANYGQPGYYLKADFRANYITANVLYNGVVLVYVSFDYADVQLPYILSDQVGASRFVEILSYELNVGSISFTLDASDFQVEPYQFPVTFKIIVIE